MDGRAAGPVGPSGQRLGAGGRRRFRFESFFLLTVACAKGL